MRIQILSTYFAPEHTGNAPYVTALARQLSVSHDVTVVAGWPHYPQWQVESQWRHWRHVERDGPLTVIRLAHYVPSKQDAARRTSYELSWATRAIAEGLRHRADVVIGFVPTLLTAPVAALVARRHHAGLGLVVQDIVSRAAVQSGIKGGRSVARMAARIERRGLARAGGVCTIHPRFAEVLHDELGVPASRLTVIYNWSHIELPTGDRPATRRRLGWPDDQVVALHSGNMGLKQDLDNVVRAARLADARALNVRFVLAGDGSQRAHLSAEGTGVQRLEIRDGVESQEFPDFLAAADVLLVNERAGMVEMSLPGKLTSYLAAGRPVVAASEAAGVTAELLAASGGGVVVPPSNPEALLTAVTAVGEDNARAEALGKAGSQFALAHLNGDAALAAYKSWVEGLSS